MSGKHGIPSEMLRNPWSGFRTIPWISWLTSSISLHFGVRAPRKISQMGDQNERIGPKTILSHQKPSKHASPVWIFDIEFQFFPNKLLTAWTVNGANLKHRESFLRLEESQNQRNRSKNQTITSETFHTYLPYQEFRYRLLNISQ